ncbi:unnamed protein product [Echinostoma caproni]|uniref:Ig-like domain-containing protein n=1 Tax=Echinostoma caproni TaxID=27848 RepID=A0A183BDY2_9TREM|nr:unnamed protein product [Echinostoma caproni]
MAPLHLTRVHPLRHNGAWSCEATSADGMRVVDQLVQLHVIPRTFDKPFGHPRVEPVTERVVHVPEGGTLFLACSFLKTGQNEGYFYEERIKWTRPQYVLFNKFKYLRIDPQNQQS